MSDVVVYNVLGKEVFKLVSIEWDFLLSKSDLGKGLFYIMIKSERKTETI